MVANKKKKKRRGHGKEHPPCKEHPPNVKVDEQATDQKSYKQDHGGQIIR